MKRKREDLSEPKESLLCKYCGYETKDIDDLDDHIVSHVDEELDDDIEEEGLDERSNEQHQIFIETEKPKRVNSGTEETQYVCPYCPYTSRKKNDMPKHLLTHNNKYDVVMYKCSQCSYETKRKCDMPKHLLTHCSNVQMYGCPECPYVTKRKNDLPKHLLCHKKLEETQVYRCEVCEYGTKRKGDLRKHMMVHTHEKSIYHCTECGYTSKRQNDLNKHTLVHCDKVVSGVFKCRKCEYATDKTNKFAKHVLSNCLLCDNTISFDDVSPESSKDPLVAVQEYVLVDENNMPLQVADSNFEIVAVPSEALESNKTEEEADKHEEYMLINMSGEAVLGDHTLQQVNNQVTDKNNPLSYMTPETVLNEDNEDALSKVVVVSGYSEDTSPS